MALSTEYQHFKLHLDERALLWVGIDRHGSAVNSLSRDVLSELEAIVDDVAVQSDEVKCVIFYSLKKTGFIAGADISQFTALKTEEEAFNLIRQGQLVFSKLAALLKPTVAMIKGYCLGGGLEFALACRYRVADNSQKTKLGLPEVLLGIHPGWLGTVRLPACIGAPKAMKLIVTGKIVSAQEAAKLGFIDAAVPERVLESAAISYALRQPEPHTPSAIESWTNKSLFRPVLAKAFRSKLKQRLKPDQYPAPFAVIENWEKYGIEGAAILQEAKSIGNLIVHPTSRNLVRLFFLKERLKGLAKGFSFTPKHVHVVGAGTMGSAIAAWCVLCGLTVTLQDQTPEVVAGGIRKAYGIIQQKLKSKHDLLSAKDRLNADVHGSAVGRADVVIEAIFENLEAKHSLYQELEPKLKEGALFATNTSSLPLSELAKGLSEASALVGIHFFNPVEKMELVEVVSAGDTRQDKINDAIAFVKKINRLPLPVKSEPGFLVNRILMPYLLESMLLMEEGVPITTIDKVAKDFGMPMGPIELADRVGLDVCLSVAEILIQHLGGDIPSRLLEKVAGHQLGVKSGEGFYVYQKGKAIPPQTNTKLPLSLSDQDISDRLILRMVNESVACLREGIVGDGDLVDAGMVFGTGFAPFRGGPIHYAKTRGVEAVQSRLEQLASQYGERFLPDQGWGYLFK